MLQRQHRLPAHTRLNRPSFFKSPQFSVKVVRNNLDVSRFGFVVKKTTDKRATVRNRIKRLFRSCIEEKLLEIQGGFDMLFLLEKGIIEKHQDEVCREVHKFLTEQKLLK